jgi:hypothetical protein
MKTINVSITRALALILTAAVMLSLAACTKPSSEVGESATESVTQSTPTDSIV